MGKFDRRNTLSMRRLNLTAGWLLPTYGLDTHGQCGVEMRHATREFRIHNESDCGHWVDTALNLECLEIQSSERRHTIDVVFHIYDEIMHCFAVMEWHLKAIQNGMPPTATMDDDILH
ncbi:hypothetical protein EVAR_25733_1 [Eumeta japonica]|uniref:Uncharacterized protein n=1 Tax=Eumeta variegata TaxID=151549 RepID=A0A4C1V7Q9_EUMVA|nr:hypothetical protein EVAR_25733_1 [Eumeta japonica]